VSAVDLRQHPAPRSARRSWSPTEPAPAWRGFDWVHPLNTTDCALCVSHGVGLLACMLCFAYRTCINATNHASARHLHYLLRPIGVVAHVLRCHP
jgi:hypothetical protein